MKTIQTCVEDILTSRNLKTGYSIVAIKLRIQAYMELHNCPSSMATINRYFSTDINQILNIPIGFFNALQEELSISTEDLTAKVAA